MGEGELLREGSDSGLGYHGQVGLMASTRPAD